MDFYYGDHLRGVFGFENPNKAAALIASLLPLLWIVCGIGWQWKRRWLRAPFLLAGSAMLIAGWYCLFKTYSRGGIVAALLAFLYIGWMCRKDWRRRWLTASLMAIVIAALFFSTKVADRSVGWVAHRDNSVENRFTLWRGGLQMLSDFPGGVGRGNSGSFYMQWFEPQHSTEGYRTLVNSYLTFATEQGIWIFGLAFFGAVLFWQTTRLKTEDAPNSLTATFGIGFRAALIAMCVAGFFSTTLETFSVWIPGIAAMLGLLAISGIRWRERNVPTALKSASLMAICACAVLWGSGSLLRGDLAVSGNQSTILISPRYSHGRKTLSVWTDEKVVGKNDGKLLRDLAEKTGRPIRAVANETHRAGKTGSELLAMGDQALAIPPAKFDRLILLAPAIVSETQAARVLKSSKNIEILNPAIDEDGRAAFWREMIRETGSNAQIQTLDDVGIRVDWDWNEVIKQVEAS